MSASMSESSTSVSSCSRRHRELAVQVCRTSRHRIASPVAVLWLRRSREAGRGHHRILTDLGHPPVRVGVCIGGPTSAPAAMSMSMSSRPRYLRRSRRHQNRTLRSERVATSRHATIADGQRCRFGALEGTVETTSP